MHYATKWTGHVFLAALLLAAGAPAAHATDYHWIGAGTGGNTATDPANTTTQWNNPANWLENKVPTSADKALLPLANAGYVNAATAVLSGLRVDGPSAEGAYHIGDGANVSTPSYGVNVGLYAQGRVLQTGGSLLVGGVLNVGAGGANGSYRLEGGTLTANLDEYIGYGSTGTFTQTGGTHVVQGALNVGYYGSTGTLNMGGGVLIAGQLTVYSAGTLNVTNPQARLEIDGGLTVSANATISALPGTALHLGPGRYPIFDNHSSNEVALAGLENLAVFFDSDTSLRGGLLEVAGADLGPTALGFKDNFVMGSVVLGATNPVVLWLEDYYDNGNRSSPEALYVHNLTIYPGSTLEMEGLNVYYDGTLDNQGTITGGSPQFVPEPATVGILVAGLAGLLIRTGRRAWV